MYLLIAIPLFTFLVWLYFKWIQMKKYWPNLGVPQASVHPIFGSMTFLQKKNTGLWLAELYQKYKKSPYVGIWVFWRRGLVINSPDLARRILVKDADIFRNRLIASGKNDPMGALNLLTVDDPLWSSIRRRLTTVFTGSKLRGWTELYHSKVKDLVYRIDSDNEKGIPVDLRNVFADYATDIIGESSFGIQCTATRDSTGPLREMTKEFEKYSPWRGLAWSSIFFLPEFVDVFRFSLWPRNTVDYFRKVFKVMVEERGGFDRESDGKKDLLDALLKMRQDAKKDNQDMNMDILISNAMVFLQGGYDTSSTVLLFTVSELAHHPKIQQTLYEELVQAKEAREGKEFDADSLSQLPYLDAVIKGSKTGKILLRDTSSFIVSALFWWLPLLILAFRSYSGLGTVVVETLRKYPIMGWMDRLALKDYQIDDKVTIPANTVVYVNAIGMHKDSTYFPEPEAFKPERFLPENADKIVPYSYLPFGEGPRMCIGKRIGMNTVRYGLAAVVLNFELLPLPQYPAPNDIPIEKRGMFYHSAIPLSVEFKRRK